MAADPGIEAHQADRSGVAGKCGDNSGRGTAVIAAPCLQFDQDWDSPGDHFQQAGKQGNLLRSVEELLPGKDLSRCCFNREGGRTHSPEIMIVKNDRQAVARQPDIAFDSRARLGRRTKSGHAVFRDTGTVQPAMGEAHWSGI
ncbi:MAG TPA: hypothetical protein VFR36_01925 [Sphingomicrobium sp.]|nr:hypothetical protein [Sphingomicrobium sp.]